MACGHKSRGACLSVDMADFTASLESLAEQALAGQRSSLDALCLALQGPVYRLALRTLGDPAEAQDACQDVLVQVVTHLAQFQGRSRLMTWVYTIATRHLLRRKRSRAEAPLQIEDVARAIDLGLSRTHPSSEPEGDVQVLQREVRLACTQSLLWCLSREERLAILLVEMLGADDEVGAAIC